MIIYALRHGQTNYNLLGLCNDDPQGDVHLTDQGRAQARAAAVKLQDTRIDYIFTSRLPRTIETAGVINRYHGLDIEPRPELDDIRSGFDDRPVGEYFAATGRDRLHLRVNGGESLLDYRQRVLGFVDWLRQQPFGCVLLVVHEETLRVLHAHFHQLAPAQMERLSFGNCQIQRFVLP
jgi:broad specificity phosphatase PhoE